MLKSAIHNLKVKIMKKLLFLIVALISQPALADFVYGNGFYLNTDGGSASVFNIPVNITKSTYESVGPSGSGAANTWAAMDDIPDGATMAIVYALVSASSFKADKNGALSIFARQAGSEIPLSARQQIFSIGGNASRQGSMFLVPLDSLRRFDITYNAFNYDRVSIIFWLKGYVM